MKKLIKWAVVACNAFLLIACSPPMPDLDLGSNRNAANKQHFKWEERKPLRKVKLAGDFFISKQLDSNLPADKAKMPISIKFSGRVATLGDIIFILEQKGLPVSYNWTVYEDVELSGNSGGSSSDESMDLDEDGFSSQSYSTSQTTDSSIVAINTLENRAVPFKTYTGTLEGLFRRLQKSMNISYWWEDDTIFLSTNQEYVVSIPQQQDIIDSIASEIEALGATDVSSSLTAGQIVYYAKPRAQENLIRPFLQRISHNLSEITLQVALVQVEINSAESKGFDWDAFDINVGSPSDAALFNTNDVSISPYNGDTANPAGSIAGEFFRRGISIFGTETDVSVDVAINILSVIGKTTTEQNVEMRTISGKEVSLESVSEESYVSGYDGGSYGDNPEPPSPEFDTVETGLTLTFLPVFDAYNAIVTIDASIAISDRLGDTIVDAGSGFEQITVRPNIKKDSFEDIVRIPVGETVILGGLMNEEFSDRRTAPMGFWDVNSAKQDSTKQALFLIIRPLVTLYETTGNEMKLNEDEILKNVKYNYEKAEEKKQEDIEKAKAEAEEKAAAEKAMKAAELEKAKANVDKKAIALEKKRKAKAESDAEIAKKVAKMKKELEKKHSAELKAKEKEATKLKAEMEQHKKARAVLEAESEWEKEEVIVVTEDIVTETVVEETKTEEPLSNEEAKKIEMLNMLRGIKN